MNGGLSFDDRALGVILCFPFVLFDHIHPLDDDSVLASDNLKDFAFLVLVVTRDDNDLVSFFTLLAMITTPPGLMI